MQKQDFTKHNEEVKQVWDAYRAGKPIRVPMTLGIGPRIWIFDPKLNQEGIEWEQFSNDPELMFQTFLKYKYYVVHNLPHDIEMGIPSSHWEVWTEFVNVTEEAWLGNELYYPPGQVTATRPRYTGDKKNEIFDRGIPDPFSGIFARVKEYHEYFIEKAKSFEFYGKPVKVLPPCPLATDGIFTVAFNIRGSELLEDIMLDAEYFHKLLTLVTDAIILKIKAWRKYLNVEMKPKSGAFADDAIQFISTEMYREHVLPYHRRFLAELAGEGPHAIHLCGDVQRHLPTLVKELNIKSFDLGYPIDYTKIRDELGDDVEIFGGPLITDLLALSPEEIKEKSRHILCSSIKRGGKFIFKEANNLPPCVPIANIQAMYDSVKLWGKYEP
ncbi:MAG: hypothetical protein N3A72_00990 [bacterium]|nr:hypothetical protein [bacterium]